MLGQLERVRARVVVVSFGSPESLARYAERFDLGGATLLSDVERAAYGAFGFDRAGVARAWLDPRVWWSYAKLLARGRRMERPTEDTLQLGGDVLTDAEGRIAWVHRSRGPEDRPTLDELAAARERT